jgi:bacterioferritin-associated ferredoxin
MYVCLCNPFSDKKVQDHLSRKNAKTTVSELYGACSNGEKPECCSCMQTLKDIVKNHNKNMGGVTA